MEFQKSLIKGVIFISNFGSGGIDIDGDGQEEIYGIPSDWGIHGYPGSNISVKNSELRDISSGIYLLGNSGNRQTTSFSNVVVSNINSSLLTEYSDLSFSNVDWQAPLNGYSMLIFDDTKADFKDVSIHDGEEGPLVLDSNIIFTGGEISDMFGPTFMIYNGSSLFLSDSSIFSIAPDKQYDAAIEIYNSSDATMTNTTISGVDDAAVQVFGASSLAFSRSSVANSSEGFEVYSVGSSATISSSTISNIADAALASVFGTADISGTSINNGSYGIDNLDGEVKVSSSAIYDIDQYAAFTPDSTSISAENNFWGDPSGPYNPDSNPTGLGSPVSDNVDFSNWLATDPTVNICCSNVMFLPGIEGSRLYMPGILIENELWEPNRDNDGKDLEFDKNGDSINQNVYTKVKDVVDIAYSRFFGPFGLNVYKTFISGMDSLKSHGTINDWEPIAYDWRLPYDQILDSGKVTDDEISYLYATDSPYVIQELKRLAGSSKTGRVTIIAHSNGGLLAKDLMIKLQAEGLSNLVDKIVFVAVPQIGTPDAIGALLHGFGTSIPIPTFFSANEGRELAENMPMTYDLLPSQAYFNSVTTPVVIYGSTSTIPFIESLYDNYGQSIGSYDTLKSFLLGAEGRGIPSYDDLAYPSIANFALIDEAETTHAILDNWTPPPDIKLIQIAGWGDDTPSGIDYYQGIKKGEATLEYKPNIVEDGDGTVVVPSALATPISSNIERYWLDLGSYNNDERKDLSHATIFEMGELENFLKNIIQDGTSSLPEYISTTSPKDIPNEELRFFLHAASSTIDVYDDAGDHTGISTTTGLVEENVPGTTYKSFGNVTLVTIPASHSGSTAPAGSGQASPQTPDSSKSEKAVKVKKPKIKIISTSKINDSVTISVDEASGSNISSSESFVDIPVSTSSTAEIDLASSTPEISDVSTLNLDESATGADDFVVLPVSSTTIPSQIIPEDEDESDTGVSEQKADVISFRPSGSRQRSVSQSANPPLNKSLVTPNVPAYVEKTNDSLSSRGSGQNYIQTTSTALNSESASIFEAISRDAAIKFILDNIHSVFKDVIDFLGSIF